MFMTMLKALVKMASQDTSNSIMMMIRMNIIVVAVMMMMMMSMIALGTMASQDKRLFWTPFVFQMMTMMMRIIMKMKMIMMSISFIIPNIFSPVFPDSDKEIHEMMITIIVITIVVI